MFASQPIKKSELNKVLKKIAVLNGRNQIRSVTLESDKALGGPIIQSIKIEIVQKNTTDDLRL